MNLGQINSVLTFFVLIFGFGHSVFFLTKAMRSRNAIIHAIEMAGTGLAVFTILSVILNLLHIPLHVVTFLILALICPIISIIQSARKQELPDVSWNIEETICAAVVLVIMVAVLALMFKGATTYPYLEDDDPWNHAQGATYIAREHTYSVDPAIRAINGGYTMYLEPYPPTYDVLMGIMRQLNDSIVWTLKFFNALLIAITIGFFFLFARVYLKSDMKAVLATFILAALPSFMSHFIWSQTLAIALFPIALYAFVKALSDTSWRIPAIVLIAAEMVTQPVVSFVFGVVVIIAVCINFVYELLQKRSKKPLLDRFPMTASGVIVGAGGLALSFVYWGAQLAKWGLSGILQLKGGELTTGWMSGYTQQTYAIFSFSGNPLLFPPHQSMIDQAIGWGSVVTLLLIAAVILIFVLAKKTIKEHWVYPHMLVWFLLIAYAVFAPTIGLAGWGSSRMWAYLAIPVALLAAEGAFIIVNSATKSKGTRIGILLLIAVLIGITSIPAKVAVQTAFWPPGAQWVAQEELAGYVSLQQVLPKNTRLYAFCGGDQRAIGFDMQSDPWDPDVATFRSRKGSVTAQEALEFLRANNYEAVTFDATCIRDWGQNATESLLSELGNSGSLQIVGQQAGFLVARVS